MYYQLTKSSYMDSLKILEADIEHANGLAAEIPMGKSGVRLQMKLVCSNLAPFFIFLLQWMDFSCLLPRYFDFFHILIYKVRSDGRWNLSRYGRKATIREFYGVILPSLERLHINFSDLPGDSVWYSNPKAIAKKNYDVEDNRFIMTNVDSEEREEECGICLEPCTKMVLPNCCHAMCIKCYRNWNTKSESCPFCRGSIKRVNSEDLWVLTCDEDVVDPETVTKEDLLRFYLHINSLPKDYPEAVFLGYNEYLI
ncbi:RING/U-box superfamily protein [Raphanus sativus]|uniref:E3 ubiquitin-protein ligase AIRP2 n=1 Tax=Raphanus sativus TaxID=3726 RepID=A0A6J0M6K0_RAPSA|nr:E3 ubiquitin-protein ligase AIRP2 [Raphanus sativus]KAJ4916675.1 RING/U-box superfamily protein [Raphanus sativus]